MAWFGNDYECGSIAQSIIKGTDKLPMPDRKRGSDMIKCPNCGSTAQPKLNTPPSVYNMGALVITTHKCGCGCVFERRYTIHDVVIVSK